MVQGRYEEQAYAYIVTNFDDGLNTDKLHLTLFVTISLPLFAASQPLYYANRRLRPLFTSIFTTHDKKISASILSYFFNSDQSEFVRAFSSQNLRLDRELCLCMSETGVICCKIFGLMVNASHMHRLTLFISPKHIVKP